MNTNTQYGNTRVEQYQTHKQHHSNPSTRLPYFVDVYIVDVLPRRPNSHTTDDDVTTAASGRRSLFTSPTASANAFTSAAPTGAVTLMGNDVDANEPPATDRDALFRSHDSGDGTVVDGADGWYASSRMSSAPSPFKSTTATSETLRSVVDVATAMGLLGSNDAVPVPGRQHKHMQCTYDTNVDVQVVSANPTHGQERKEG